MSQVLHLGGGNDAKKKKVFNNIRDNYDPKENWDMIGELGDGAFGKVSDKILFTLSRKKFYTK